MADRVPTSPTLPHLVRQWPIATKLAQNLPAGSLINLARTSSSLRAALHGFDDLNTYESDHTEARRSGGQPDALGKDILPRKGLQLGHHRTPYWEGLKRAAQFTCSSRTHTKGDKMRSCRYCSAPICESCVIKHGFAKSENTFKNRCRFMCQRCWNTGNQQRQYRYSGRHNSAEKGGHKFARENGRICICTSQDGWLCNDCKENQNDGVRLDGLNMCFGQDCEMELEDDKDRRKICLWCDNPLPRGRVSMQSRLAFDQKLMMMGASERAVGLPADTHVTEYPRISYNSIPLSRRAIRGNHAVKDDPDADVPQYLPTLSLHFGRDQPRTIETCGTKVGKWKYDSDFLRCFMTRCTKHKDAISLRNATFLDQPGPLFLKTNMDVWMIKNRTTLDEPFEAGAFSENLTSATSDWAMVMGHESAEEQTLVEESMLAERRLAGEEALDEAKTLPREKKRDKEMNHPSSRGSNAGGVRQQQDDEWVILQNEEISEAYKKTQGQPRPDQQGAGTGVPEVRPGEQPPGYGADTQVLEVGEFPRFE